MNHLLPMNRNGWLAVLLGCGLVFCTAFSGCVQNEPARISTAPVRGFVFLDGIKIASARVLFIPVIASDDDGRLLPFSYGMTNDNGQFEMMFANKKPGAWVGKHRVLISKLPEADYGNSDNDLNFDPKTVSDYDAKAVRKQMSNANANEIATNYLKESGAVLKQPSVDGFLNDLGDDLIPIIYNQISMLECEVDGRSGGEIHFNLTTVHPLLKTPDKPLVEYH